MDPSESFLDRDLSVAEAWALWERGFSLQTRAGTELLLRETPIARAMTVLDLGSGAGEPALAISRAVGPDGHVVATDFSGDAMAALAHKVAALGYSNMETRQADMHALPFPDAEFDAVTARLSVMFCARPLDALREMIRVLRPGGNACLLVWGLPTQPLFACTLGAIQKRAPLPLAPVGQPGPFQFSESGTLGEAMKQAGFSGVTEQDHVVPWPWPGSPHEMWIAFSDLSGPALRPGFDALPREEQRELEREIIQGLTAYFDGKVTDPRATVNVARGSK